MKKKFIIISVILLIIGGVGFWAYQKLKSVSGDISEKVEELTQTQEVSVSAITISDISPTNQLKVLSMYKEILVQSKKVVKTWGGFSEDTHQLCAIYPAELDFGIDFSRVDINEVFSFRNDSLIVNLPGITILNKDGVSVMETSRRTAIETGDCWTNDDRSLQKIEAEYLMLRSCEMDGCWEMAQSQAIDMIKESLKNLGYNKVGVSFGSSLRYYFYADKEIERKRPLVYMTNVDNSAYLADSNDGSSLEWIGSIDWFQLINIWDFCIGGFDGFFQVLIENNNGNPKLVYKCQNVITQSDKQKFINHFSSVPEMGQSTHNLLHTLYGWDVTTSVVATDYKGDVFYTF